MLYTYRLVDQKILISKMASPQISKIGHQLHEIYSGEENAMLLEKVFRINFVCRFRSLSQFFPFGSEKCHFRGFIKGSDSLNTQINISSFKSFTADTINQFKVKDWKIPTLDEAQQAGLMHYGQDTKGQFFVMVTLCSNMDTIFFVTYLPTILMNIINQAVVYIGSDQSNQE